MPSGPNNADTGIAWRYHDGTKHSYQSVRTNPHYLDWSNRPLPFKIYPGIGPIRLPKEVPQTGMAALSVIAENVRPAGTRLPALRDLALLLYFSAGITRRKTYPGGEI